MRQKLARLVKEALKKLSFFGKVEEVANKRRHAFHERVAAETKTIQRLLEEPETAERMMALRRAHRRRKTQHRKLLFWRKRYVWARERHQHWGLVLRHRRDRLRHWIARHEGFQPYMANGNPYEKLTAEAKASIYRMFRRGMYVTSTYEGHPGDGVHSTSSGHYVENQPDGQARCYDCGSASFEGMAAAQRAEAEVAGSFMVELLGPDNRYAYKNGIRYTLSEGSVLENMHDNHNHVWVRDGAPR